jgi:hypothetical protein
VNQRQNLPEAKDYQYLPKLEPEKQQQAGRYKCGPVIEHQNRPCMGMPDVLQLVVNVFLVGSKWRLASA